MSHDWKKVLIKPNNTIRDALEIINNEALRVALVVNEKDELLGILTDGDIRRGLLKNLPLTGEVSLVMNSSPTTASKSVPRQELINIMNSKSILSIPILEDKKVVGLETLHNMLSKRIYHNPVFLMAGGFGTRLKPLTDSCPKPMLKIGGKPILEIIIRSFINAGFINFYISTHYMPEKIRNYFGDGSSFGINISYVHEKKPLGTGGALGLLPDNLPEELPLIMMNADILTKVDFQRLLEFHIENESAATMCVREYDYQIPYGVVNGEGNKITSMVEKPIQRFFVNAGIYVISSSIVKSVEKNCRIDMPTLLEKHLSQREHVLMFPIHEYWLDIGQINDFNKAQTDINALGMLL